MFLFFHTCPCFATLRHSFLGITPHPLTNCLAPNPNGRCSPLSFGSLVFPICLPLYVPSFFKALPFLHFMPFFQTFSCAFLRFFKSFLPAISSFSQQFPQFSLVFPSLPFIFSSILMVFFNIFLHFPPFLTIFLHFPWFFPTFFLSVFRGPRENRTAPSPNCLVVHAPLKNSNWPPLSPPDIEISVHLGNLPPHTPS